jgi:hypothetical protein
MNIHRWLRERLRGARGSNFAERNNKWPSEPQATSDRLRALPVSGFSTAYADAYRRLPDLYRRAGSALRSLPASARRLPRPTTIVRDPAYAWIKRKRRTEKRLVFFVHPNVPNKNFSLGGINQRWVGLIGTEYRCQIKFMRRKVPPDKSVQCATCKSRNVSTATIRNVTSKNFSRLDRSRNGRQVII